MQSQRVLGKGCGEGLGNAAKPRRRGLDRVMNERMTDWAKEQLKELKRNKSSLLSLR